MSGVGITGLIKPLNGAPFPVWEDINGLGGYRAEADASARDAIPAQFRKVGMTVVTQDSGNVYKLTGGITNGDWQPFGTLVSLAQHDIGTGGAAPTFDWSAFASIKCELDQDCDAVFVDPPASQFLVLVLTGKFRFGWPRSHDTQIYNGFYNTPANENFYFIYFCKESGLYYPLGQTSSETANLSTVNGHAQSVTEALNVLDVRGPKGLGSYLSGNGPFSHTISQLLASVPEEKLIYQVTSSVTVNTPITSGTIDIQLTWTDSFGETHVVIILSVPVGAIGHGQATYNFPAGVGTEIDWEANANTFVGGTPNVQLTLTFQRLNEGNLP